MIIIEYIAIEILIFTVSAAILLNFLRKFEVLRQISTIILLPLILFVIGFSLRLTEKQENINIGFFFTDFSYLFVYLVFALAFILGQIKYWRLK